MKIKIKIDYLFLLVAVTALLSLAIFLITNNSNIKIPRLWQWVLTLLFGVFVIVLLFRAFKIKTKKLNLNLVRSEKTKEPKVKKKLKIKWSWLKWTIGVAAVVAILWFTGGVSYAIRWWNWQTRSTSTTSNSTNTSDQNLPKLNMNGVNIMSKGQFFEFKVDWDDKSISFDPEGSDTTTLFFYKAENATRKWTLKLWKNPKGKKEYRFDPRPPLAEALVGRVRVCCQSGSSVVFVSQ